MNDLAAQKIERRAGFEQQSRRRLKPPAHNRIGHFLQELKVLRGERPGCRASGKGVRHCPPETVPEQSTRHIFHMANLQESDNPNRRAPPLGFGPRVFLGCTLTGG